jgi:hypothetical protein
MTLVEAPELPSTGRGDWVYYPLSATRPTPTKRHLEDDLERPTVVRPKQAPPEVPFGKWMLFYPKSDMDRRWLKACECLEAGKFGIVDFMKASTFVENPRSSNPNNGVIILYTKPSSQTKVMDTGMAVMEAMAYDRRMYFKTDRQTRLGTAATGRSKNHTFALCPTPPKITNYADAFKFEE